MYLWRNLPKGQLSAVLRWLGNGRQPAAAVTPPPQSRLEIPTVSSGTGSAPKA